MVDQAFDVMSDKFVPIAHIKTQESEYTLHKPRREPYQSIDFAARVLWVHKTDRYVVWVVGGKHFLTVSEQDLLDELGISDIDALTSKASIGQFIDDYRLDRAKYVAEDPKKKKAGQSGEKMKKKQKVVPSTEATDTVGDAALEDRAEKQPEAGAEEVEKAADEEEAAEVAVEGAPAEEEVASEEAVEKEKEKAIENGPSVAEAVALLLARNRAGKVLTFEDEAAEEAAETAPEVADCTVADGTVADLDDAEKQKLQAELDRQKERAAAAEADAENERRKHRNYIRTKSKEVNKLKEEIKNAPSAEEMQRLKKENAAAQSIMASEKYQELKASGTDASARFHELIGIVKTAYQKRIDDAKEKGKAYEAAMDAAVSAASTKSKETVYQFLDDLDQWVDITDPQFIGAFDSLGPSNKKVQHSGNGHAYTLNYVSTNIKPVPIIYRKKAGVTTVNYTQINNDTSKQRRVRKIESDKAPRETLINGMLAKDRNHILFGDESPVELPDDLVDSWLNGTNFCKPPEQEFSRELAELADIFGQCSDSGFKYTVDAKTPSTHMSSNHFISHTDGTKDFNSELWIKPSALSQWLSHAHFRGYKHARIVCHGASKAGYAGMRSHGIGFSMDFAGSKNGQAYGPGLYFGLSDHATVFYNRHSGYPPGTFAIGLVLTRGKEGWQHHHGGYTMKRMDERMTDEEISTYKTISFTRPVHGTDDAMVLHDPALALCIGIVHSFDDKHGYGWLYRYSHCA